VIQLKSRAEVARMRAAGLVVADTLAALRAAVAPGITTRDLDALADREIRARGAVPSFLGYGVPPFPATICASVNDEVVHGIPGERVLRAGDVVSIDCGAILAGWHGDAAVTVPVGEVPQPVERLLSVTEGAMWAGLAAMVPGARLRDVSGAVEDHVVADGTLGIVEDYGGHGIGTEMHQDPHVLNYRTRARGPRLVPGLALAIEPMLTLGRPATRLLDDDWTVATVDGSRAAHFEHTAAVTPTGVWVLTAADGGEAGLAGAGARPAPWAA
jgi:methionyl aminopeptidase